MLMREIEKSELNRQFCKHGIEHSLDVARIAYIISLEQELDIDKDLIYAAALLHDIGRAVDNESHSEESVAIAEPILKDCGYSYTETALILAAVRLHRAYSADKKSLSGLIGSADKLSRQCWKCNAYSECYWQEDKKNNSIIY
jgi:uncharacterized protein